MVGETVYAELNISSEPSSSRTLHPSQQLYASQLPHWQKITLCIACIGNIILLAALIALALQVHAEKEKDRTDVSRTTVAEKSNMSLANFRAHLRSRLCNQIQGNSSVNSTCRVCPAYWHLHRNKCYWWNSHNPLKTWNDSRNDCLARSSQLLVVKNKEVLDFVTKTNEDRHYAYWIGLSLSLPKKKWMWITRSQLDQNIFQEPNLDEGLYCGLLRNSKVTSDDCSTKFRWICQMDAVLM